ncbi:MAG: hypothetical protein ACI9X4_000836 [Glaciecola sp.]|jgi:hypothetical protein
MRLIQLLCLLAIILTAPLFAQEQAAPPCQHCKGKTQVEVTCMACEGKRKVGCSDCSGHVLQASQKRGWMIELQREGKTTAEEYGVHLLMLSSIEATSAQLNGVMKPKPGYLNCPANLMFFGAHGDCKLCRKKGKVRCKGCGGKGLRTCSGCSGKGKLNRQCVACKGSGHDNDYPRLDKGSKGDCGWCPGTALTTCQTCVAPKSLISTCHDCQGSKSKICKDCNGQQKTGCKPCLGRGVSSFPGSKSKCGACKGKGIVDCNSCKRGKTECEACQGKGKAQWVCPDCMGKPSTPCLGCNEDQTLYWEAGAQYWKALNVNTQMNQYLDLAIEHKKKYLDLLEEAYALAAKGLAKEGAAKKGRPKLASSPFKDTTPVQEKWLKTRKKHGLRQLHADLMRLEGMRTADK